MAVGDLYQIPPIMQPQVFEVHHDCYIQFLLFERIEKKRAVPLESPAQIQTAIMEDFVI